MSPRLAWSLFGLHILVLIVGTQMPNAWRNGVEQSLHVPFSLSSWAHFVVFCGMSLLLMMRPLAYTARRVILLALVLALMTEALQFFAVDRHPRLIDMGIDMAGTLLAVMIMALRGRWAGAGRSSRQ
ncbi:VanZ family protein [Polaromonas glacialis]|uniref:VanZ family protein n=1 Tax=Polaromonas glacialis TaxID=866564 RepID=UPI000B2DAC54|nr:VanZ family protein [Polaromonas glacialis]